jgi:SAM-dependent methyltransferase
MSSKGYIHSMLSRSLIDLGIKAIAYARRNQRIDAGSDIVKVNVGCGLSVTGDWINLDGSLNALIAGWPFIALKMLFRASGSRQWFSQEQFTSILRNHRFVHHEVRYGLPFADQSVDYVYSSHFLEHLYREDAEGFLTESFRVLKTGGVIRILTPDLAEAIAAYEEGHKEEALSTFFSGRVGMYGQHHYLYDYDILRDLLVSIGFAQVTRPQYREGLVPDVEVLDGRPGSLIAEATK